MRKGYALLLILFISLFNLNSESIKLIKKINFNIPTKNSKLVSFIFGKKQKLLIRPSSITQLKDNTYCITDQENGMVMLFDDDGKIIKKIRSFGKKRFISPVSCCKGEFGSFFVSDSFHRKIIEFTSNYKFKKPLIGNKKNRITGISYYSGKLFCTDTENHKIVIYNRSGYEIFSFGQRGGGPGEFNFPTHLTVDEKYIYVNDALNFRIQIFDHKGKFVRKFGQNGRNGGEFSKPKGIAVDSKQRIFVSDVIFDNVQVFDINGRFLSYFGETGTSDGQFWMPSGVAINDKGEIVVADKYNSRVHIYKIYSERK